MINVVDRLRLIFADFMLYIGNAIECPKCVVSDEVRVTIDVPCVATVEPH